MNSRLLVAAHPTRAVSGLALHVREPISFWGGVSPLDGTVTDQRSSHYGHSVTNTVMFVRELRGSSSASSVLLELIYKKIAPSAIVLAVPDAILALGALIGREMNWTTPAILRMNAADQDRIADGPHLIVTAEGWLSELS